MQTKLLPDLEQHTLMLADSHNIFLKLKSNGILGEIGSLFKKIYLSEIDFASKELKRISKDMECKIDLEVELKNNSEIFRANLKEIVSKVIDIIWEGGRARPLNSLEKNIVGNVFQDSKKKEGGSQVKEGEDPRSAASDIKEDADENYLFGKNEFEKTYEVGSNLFSKDSHPIEYSSKKIGNPDSEAQFLKTQEIENLKKKTLESKTFLPKPFF